MKNLLRITIVVCSIAMFTSCKVNHGTVKSSTAPGQVKKMTGAKSAKAYAPGQQKKKGNNE
ncbi:hypothetical protein [Flagellimonas lutimaris]|uniref:hypothetical protein n=1 Tax=Flagellimonas TaxID=444459 RepID=UPI000B75B5AF|nr:MAG: hypothetical protein CBB72_005560 [Muricauda sp. TMED12]|tara:strand:- start:21403 stop:21585 length:183 start_codon:yes stop_codon:yes gene_type:complete